MSDQTIRNLLTWRCRTFIAVWPSTKNHAQFTTNMPECMKHSNITHFINYQDVQGRLLIAAWMTEPKPDGPTVTITSISPPIYAAQHCKEGSAQTFLRSYATSIVKYTDTTARTILEPHCNQKEMRARVRNITTGFDLVGISTDIPYWMQIWPVPTPIGEFKTELNYSTLDCNDTILQGIISKRR